VWSLKVLVLSLFFLALYNLINLIVYLIAIVGILT